MRYEYSIYKNEWYGWQLWRGKAGGFSHTQLVRYLLPETVRMMRRRGMLRRVGLLSALQVTMPKKIDYQKRYVAYAKAHGKNPGQMLHYDTNNYQGGCMAGYILWINARIREFRKHSSKSFMGGKIIDHDAFSEYLFT